MGGDLRILVIGSAALLLAASASAQADPAEVSLSTGLDYSSGKYGLRDTTDILVALTDATVKWDDFQFSVSEPYLDIKGPGIIVAGAGGVPVAKRRGGPLGSVTRAGWGDLNISATYSLPPDALPDDLDGYEVDLTGRGKIAIANAARGLSSGESDFSFSVDVSRQIGIWAPFVTFGYRVPGSPSSYALESAPSFSVGSSVQLTDEFLAIVSYDFDGTISDSLADSEQLMVSASWIASDAFTVTAYAEKGMSGGAPLLGTGLLLAWKLP